MDQVRSICLKCHPMKRGNVRALGLLASAMPFVVLAASNAQQELQDALSATPSLDRGAQYFVQCAACHGVSGGGTPDGAVPRLAGQHSSVLVKQLVDFRNGDRSDSRMEPRADRHHLENPQAMADVAAYASQLADTAPVGVGPGDRVAQGAALYGEACRSCHGASAEGDAGARVPRLAQQHYGYLRRQIYDAIQGRRPNIAIAHRRLLAGLGEEDIVAVADYLARATVGAEKHPVGGAGVR
jgi:cytochrome c553